MKRTTTMGNGGPATAPEARLDEGELVALFDELSNWGRWGADDELGTLNYLTADRIRAAATLVIRGISVSCSYRISPVTSTPSEPVMHAMLSTADDAPHDGVGSVTDWLGIGCHGLSITHLDAHSHIVWRRQMYGGRPASDVTARHGARSGSIEVAASGITGRGVLLDVARSRGAAVTSDDSVGPLDLDRCAAEQGVELQSGDLLVVRFGRSMEGDRSPAPHDPIPGMDARCLRWLHEHEVALLATDYASDALPSRYESVPAPIHAVGIVSMGLWILDNMDLGHLSTTCAELDRWEFLLTVSPLRISRGTGSPVNPVALF